MVERLKTDLSIVSRVVFTYLSRSNFHEDLEYCGTADDENEKS